MAHFPKSQLASDSDGGVIVELALVLPALLLFVFGIMSVGFLFWTDLQLTQATYAAARCGALNQTTCPYGAPSTIQAFAVQQAAGIANITNSTFTVTTPASCGGTAQPSVKVAASYTFTFPFPSINVTLTPTACYPTQY
jgi:Flp pilus assembly protein TadG